MVVDVSFVLLPFGSSGRGKQQEATNCARRDKPDAERGAIQFLADVAASCSLRRGKLDGMVVAPRLRFSGPTDEFLFTRDTQTPHNIFQQIRYPDATGSLIMSRAMQFKFLTVCLFASIIPATALPSDQIPGAPQKKPIALFNGVLHPISGPAIEDGTVIFDNGKIVDLGRRMKPPADATVIDLEGKHVYPSLIESHSHLGLVEISSTRSTLDMTEIGSVNPNVRAHVSVNPDSELIPVTRANGVLIAVSAPSGGLVSGKASVLQLDGWTYEDMMQKCVLSCCDITTCLSLSMPSTKIRDATTKNTIRPTRSPNVCVGQKSGSAFPELVDLKHGTHATCHIRPQQPQRMVCRTKTPCDQSPNTRLKSWESQIVSGHWN